MLLLSHFHSISIYLSLSLSLSPLQADHARLLDRLDRLLPQIPPPPSGLVEGEKGAPPSHSDPHTSPNCLLAPITKSDTAAVPTAAAGPSDLTQGGSTDGGGIQAKSQPLPLPPRSDDRGTPHQPPSPPAAAAGILLSLVYGTNVLAAVETTAVPTSLAEDYGRRQGSMVRSCGLPPPPVAAAEEEVEGASPGGHGGSCAAAVDAAATQHGSVDESLRRFTAARLHGCIYSDIQERESGSSPGNCCSDHDDDGGCCNGTRVDADLDAGGGGRGDGGMCCGGYCGSSVGGSSDAILCSSLTNPSPPSEPFPTLCLSLPPTDAPRIGATMDDRALPVPLAATGVLGHLSFFITDPGPGPVRLALEGPSCGVGDGEVGVATACTQ